MIRAVEWILAAAGAAVAIGVTLAFSPAATGDRSALAILAAVALLGFSGFLAVALDDKGRSSRWGVVTWVVAGALTSLVVLAGFSYGVFLIPAVFAFAGAGLLASRRRQRPLAGNLAVYVAGALGCALLIALANVLGRV
jgi:uncharacterized membrane protein HdeD (DUF308 family)